MAPQEFLKEKFQAAVRTPGHRISQAAAMFGCCSQALKHLGSRACHHRGLSKGEGLVPDTCIVSQACTPPPQQDPVAQAESCSLLREVGRCHTARGELAEWPGTCCPVGPRDGPSHLVSL